MIYFGDTELYGVKIGNTDISAIYAGDLLIWPTDFGNLTAITFEDLTWEIDVPSSGGTATSANCSFKVYALFDSGKRKNITSTATITGSLEVGETTSPTRESVGTITLTASYSGFTDTVSVTAYQEAYVEDWSTKYLTFKIKSDGFVRWVHIRSAYTRTIYYSKDNGNTWTALPSQLGSEMDDTGGAKVSVTAGETVIFKGTNATYGAGGYYISFERTSCDFELCGNFLSLIYGDNFANYTTMPGSSTHSFRNFFSNCTGLTSAENLILPSNVLPYCYNWSFQSCTKMTIAPTLPAKSLARGCYSRMLRINPNLAYVKCLATSGINTTNTENWLNNVSSTGTFVKAEGTTWPTGTSGIPSGWTVVDNS